MKQLQLAFIIFLLFCLSLKASAQEDNPVVVENTGSSNFSGYRLVIDSSGLVTVTSYGRISPFRHEVYADGQYHILPQFAQKLMDDTQAAWPFQLTAGGCVKSVSFGTRTYVLYKGQITPDIECLQSPPAFIKDIFEIQRNLPRPARGLVNP